ncbi:major facilitator superfamily transporter [Seiridium cupressi]
MDYSTSSKLAPIVLILQLGILCVALDNTIIATAIPRIGDELYALSDTVLICLLLFEVRSLFCALAPNSTALIIGRAIAGIGSAGLFSGALIILAFSTLPEKRPIFTGLIIAVYDIASMVGPLIGGAFTDHLTWHWCFYLPIGGIPSLALIVFLHLPPLTPRAENTTWHEVIAPFYPLRTTLFIPCVICLLLTLQWLGTTYARSNGRIFRVLFIALVID